jgi:predicted CXXCH cytochrome family protein
LSGVEIISLMRIYFYTLLKIILRPYLLASFIILCGTSTEASWLIDRERFHVSVHGQTSCQDCHGDIPEKQLHPNPDEVTRTLKSFFQSEQCIDCHSETADEIDAGSHGGETITDLKTINDCIGCHDPHYQTTYAEADPQIDLSQPVEVKCSICHDLQTKLPELSAEDEQCLQCHRYISSEDPEAVEAIAVFCFHCHGTAGENNAGKASIRYPLINPTAYRSTPHQDVACTICHLRAAEFDHDNQVVGDCRECHSPHDAKVTNAVHLRVACETCHLKGITPLKEAGSDQILWQRNPQTGKISEIHHMPGTLDEASCRGCHFSCNTMGAAAMVLPAKSIMCMPCHPATFSAGDTTTILGLAIFLLGMIGLGTVWFSGTLPGNGNANLSKKIFQTIKTILQAVFSTRIWVIIKVLILDALLQRRLFRVSRPRWVMHALVFYAFIFRFIWGLVALLASIWFPAWSGAWLMLDNNHPLTAFLFDLSGLAVIIGVIALIIRRKQTSAEMPLEGLPKGDWPAYGLLGGIMIVGFILEGMRMAMTGIPGGASYAFIGAAISPLLSGFNLTDVYGYVWYLHAILTGAFLAYLPFSRMLHMIMAPVAMAINASSQHDQFSNATDRSA